MDRKNAYNASAAVTITLASLASSTTCIAGQQSDVIDNSSLKLIDFFLSGFIKTTTSPTAGRIEVWVVPELEDASWPDTMTGAGTAAKTWTLIDIKAASGALAAVLVTDATARTYYFGKVSLQRLFGRLPRKFLVFVTHNTVQVLDSTGGNHAIYGQGVYETVT